MNKKDQQKDKERERQFGKCCWTCGNKDCFFYRYVPNEGTEGRGCQHWITRVKDENLLEGPIHITSINAMKMLEQRIDALEEEEAKDENHTD